MSAPATWGWRRRAADALARAHVLAPAVSAYQTLLGLRGAIASRGVKAEGPPVPPAQLRVRIGPSHGDLEEFLRSGERHARLIRTLLDEHGDGVETAAPILDFGCGCGRVARHWYGADMGLHGCDVMPRMVEWCRRNLDFGRFEVNGMEPPLPYRADSFGLAYLFSVFTHLPERLQHEWLREFARVLRPGGFLLFTTLGEHYVGLGRLTDDERARFDRGQLVVLFEEHAGESFCSAYHPRSYVEGTLAQGFEYVAFRPGDASEHHDIHLLRKPA